MKLGELAERLRCRLEGDGDLEIVRVTGIEHAGPGDLTFVANSRYQPLLAGSRAAAVILGPDVPAAPCAVLRSDHPYLTFADALALFAPPPPPPPAGVDSRAIVSESAILGADVSIGPFAIVEGRAVLGARVVVHPYVVIGGGARIGDDCVLHSHVSIRDGIVIGQRVVVHDGAVVGSDGFGFAKRPDGTHLKIPQRADVVIEDDVEIGANTVIDRPAVGETRVQAGTKIDNLVQIAHGVRVGSRVLIAAQVGIAGSTVIEDDVVLGGQVGVTGHVRMGKGAMASAKSGITGSVDAGVLVSGYPAIPNLEWRKASVLLRHLPELKKRVAELEQRVADLQEKLAECRTRLGP